MVNLSGFPLDSESVSSSPFRTYEELITERGNEHFNFNNYVVSTFDEIKKKIFQYNKDPVQQPEPPDLSTKYSIDTVNQNIHKLKSDICKLWNEKIVLHATLTHNKVLFQDFSESTLAIINILNEDSDSDLIKLLNKKIDDYALELNIDYFNLEESRIITELEYLKKTVKNFSEFVPSSTCGICYENQVEYFIISCGHTICGDCKDKCSKSYYCHYCRTPRGEYKKLFYC